VPFYLRTGKALATAFTEINIIFKRPPSVLFAASSDDRLRRNTLRIRIQPNEGISLKFNAKVPGKAESEPVDMSFSYKSDFNHYLPEAYERLIVDAIVGESTLFTRSDEVEEAWRLVDSIRNAWAKHGGRDLPLYACGSMGPVESDLLLEKDQRYWIRPKELAT
jgi:glucose-6-phosphate 1-dehydrogenase